MITRGVINVKRDYFDYLVSGDNCGRYDYLDAGPALLVRFAPRVMLLVVTDSNPEGLIPWKLLRRIF